MKKRFNLFLSVFMVVGMMCVTQLLYGQLLTVPPPTITKTIPSASNPGAIDALLFTSESASAISTRITIKLDDVVLTAAQAASLQSAVASVASSIESAPNGRSNSYVFLIDNSLRAAGFENAFMAKEVSVNRAALYLLRQAIQ